MKLLRSLEDFGGGGGRNLQVRDFHTWDSSYDCCKLTITLFPKWRNEIGGGRKPSVQVAKGESRFGVGE